MQHSVSADSKIPSNILVLGDSLSSAYGINSEDGWVNLLQQKSDKQNYAYRVINASVSGDTSRTGLSRIENALKQHKPVIVIIALGGNDGLRGLTFTEIKNSLSGIIEFCLLYNAKPLLAGIRLPPNYGVVYNTKFNALFEQLTLHYRIPHVVNMLHKVDEHRELLQADGIHPKAGAQAQILENIWKVLKPVLASSEKCTGIVPDDSQHFLHPCRSNSE